uniref:L antigen family member 3 n=1 Tax=Marmota marmota marmota TaxID=9994 RepID=A0A8C5YKR4_MARMA
AAVAMEAPGGGAEGTGGAVGHEDGQGGQYGSPAPGFQGISGGSIEEGSHSDFSHLSGPSGLEAEMARRSLVPDARQQEIIHKEFTVNGSDLAVRWTAEDPVLFRTSANTFLDQLSLVMRNIRHIGVPALLKRGKGKNP